jgi:DNA-directed RNA polymerase specialized sigma24 family protein
MNHLAISHLPIAPLATSHFATRADARHGTPTDDRTRRIAALDVLPRQQLALVSLAFFDGLSHVAIAQRTKLPLGTVKSRLRFAFSRLRRLLHDAGVTEA